MNIQQFLDIYKSILDNENPIDSKLDDVKNLFEDYLKQDLLIYYVSNYRSKLSFISKKEHKKSYTVFYIKRPTSKQPNHIPIDKFKNMSYDYQAQLFHRTIYIDINQFNGKPRDLHPIELVY